MLVMIDLDNTLGDRAATVVRWAAEFCSQHVLPRSFVDWFVEHDADGYADRDEVFATLRDTFDLDTSADELVAGYRSRVLALTEPVPDAAELLNELRTAGCRLAIVTNGASSQQHGKIDALGFRELIDAVLVSGDLDIAKPDPRIFQAAADATGSTLDDAWMIGDSPHHDIGGAAPLGVRTVWISRGRAWPNGSSAPTLTADSLHGLATRIVHRAAADR